MAYDPSLFGANPYTAQQAQNIQATSNQNLSQNVMPGIGQGAQGAGQYGGSRQGIAEGVAAGNAQAGVNTAQANLYSNAYQTDQNNALQNKSLDNQYALGQGQLNLSNQGQMQNFYTQNRGLDQSGAQIGANIYNSGNTGNLAAGAGQTALGQQYQNAPMTALQNYSNTISPYSGLNSGQSTVSTSGGGALGTMCGALAGAQIGKNLGFGSNSILDNSLVTTGDYKNIPAYMIQNGG